MGRSTWQVVTGIAQSLEARIKLLPGVYIKSPFLLIVEPVQARLRRQAGRSGRLPTTVAAAVVMMASALRRVV